MRVSFYLKKEIKEEMKKVAELTGSYYNAVKESIRAVALLLKLGLNPECIVVLSKLLDEPDPVEKELREGLDSALIQIIGKLNSIIESFLTNLVLTSEFIIGKYFPRNPVPIVSKYKRRFEEMRNKEERKVDILSEIEKEFGE